MIVKVRRKHISKGTPGLCSLCPVALAIKDATGEEGVFVTEEAITIDEYYYHVPRSVLRFITKFDDRDKVEPFNFKLNYE